VEGGDGIGAVDPIMLSISEGMDLDPHPVLEFSRDIRNRGKAKGRGDGDERGLGH